MIESENALPSGWRTQVTQLRARAFIWLVLLDTFSIVIGFIIAGFLLSEITADQRFSIIIAVILPIHLITAMNLDAFGSRILEEPFHAARLGLKSFVFSIAGLIFVAYSLKISAYFPRLTIGLGSVFSCIMIITFRYYFSRHLRFFVGGDPFSVVLIVDHNAPIPVGNFSIVIAAKDLFDPEVNDPMMYNRLANAVGGVDRVVVACPDERRLLWAHALKGSNVQGEIVVPEFAQYTPPLNISSYHGTTTLIVANGPLRLIDRALKRFFDLLVASVALILLSPFLLIVAIAIKIDSPGPLIFRQIRIGRGNKLFRLFKFRSMRVENSDSAGVVSAARHDDRTTQVGRFIRKTSIDELPQFLNVLMGDMSIVGPRPHALGSRAADKLFWEIDSRYWHRHAARPGITGLAQVRGYRGATLKEEDLRLRLQSDLEYLDRWTIWRDFEIVILTFRVLLHRNAF